VPYAHRKSKIFWLPSEKLSPIRQELLILKFVDQLSNAEIGQIMRKSEGAIKSLYHRTLLELREIMNSEEEE
jgi:RNA polymerase sigma-70 factor, ECF subfamily